MNIEDFEKLSRNRFDACLGLMLCQKNEEYSRNGDKLHNFKQAARIDNESPERALWGMMKKHLVSIQDIINDINYMYETIDHDTEIKLPSEKILAEKIGDTINYIVLLEALITERRKHKILP